MKFLFTLLISFNVEACLFDFLSIYQANSAYENQQFKLAGEKFYIIDNDASRLNQANSLYIQGLYKQSLKKYQSVKLNDLSFDRLYNSGNAYAKSGKINEAIDSYKAALKLKSDKDATFNLELLKKQKRKKSNNKENKKAKNKKKKNPNNKNSKKKTKNKQQQRNKLNTIKQQRWEKSLNKKLRTLMIPLNNQQDNNEQNPW